MLLVGGRVRPGIVGAHPSLTELEQGNLRHHTDFRQVYAANIDYRDVADRIATLQKH